MPNMPASLLVSSLLFALGTQADNICYFPSGFPNADVPCDAEAEVSMCCSKIANCLSSGLCRDTSTTEDSGDSYARGTCTDPTWKSPICPQHCQLNQDTPFNQSAFDFGRNGVQVWQCEGQGFAEPAHFCCESAAEKSRCCETKAALFHLPAATLGNALAIQTFPFPPAFVDLATKSMGLADPTGPTTPDGRNFNGGLSSGAVIAIAVGACIGGALLVALAIILLLRRMHRQDEDAQSQYFMDLQQQQMQAGSCAPSIYGDAPTLHARSLRSVKGSFSSSAPSTFTTDTSFTAEMEGTIVGGKLHSLSDEKPKLAPGQVYELP